MLTSIYNFLFEWLWGGNVPVALEPISSQLTILLAVLMGGAFVYFSLKIVFGLIWTIINIFRR